MNCFFFSRSVKTDIFSVLIVQYECPRGLFSFSESSANFKLVVVPAAFYDTKTVSKEKKQRI